VSETDALDVFYMEINRSYQPNDTYTSPS